LPPGRKGNGVTQLIYEHLNGLQSTMSKQNGKLEKAQQVIDNLQADIVCYNEHHQNLRHKANRNGFQPVERQSYGLLRHIIGMKTRGNFRKGARQ
jgi:hypothetical protein